MMAKAGYNPIEMARFFEKLEAEGGARAPQFLSSHPNPGNRVVAVQREIQTLPQQRYDGGTGRFSQVKSEVARLRPSRSGVQQARAGQLEAPSQSLRRLETNRFVMAYPAGWNAYGDDRSPVVTLAPREGLVRAASGGISIGYGAVLSYYQPQSGRANLEGATRELISQLASLNRGMRVGETRRVQVDGNRALITTLTGASPFGGAETNMLLTVARPEGLFYMVCVAPQNQFSQLGGAFEPIVQSIQFRG
jgi:hypothetical protein